MRFAANEHNSEELAAPADRQLRSFRFVCVSFKLMTAYLLAVRERGERASEHSWVGLTTGLSNSKID